MVANKKYTRSGYTVVYWNTEPDGSGDDYYGGSSYTADEALELYAIWGLSSVTPSVAKSNANIYYGAYVNYVPKNGCRVKWRVFYADSTRIYLIAEDYVPNSYLTATGLTKSTRTDYNLKDYCVYSGTNRQDLVTRLTNSAYYIDFKDTVGKASSVVGAPTLEQYKTSYNAVNTDASMQMNILNCTRGQAVTPGLNDDNPVDGKTNAEGYVLRFGNTGSYGYYSMMPPNTNKINLYIRTSNTNARGMWLASFSADDGLDVVYASYGGEVGCNSSNDFFCIQYNGLRPLVTLNSNVKLVDTDGDGVYDLE